MFPRSFLSTNSSAPGDFLADELWYKNIVVIIVGIIVAVVILVALIFFAVRAMRRLTEEFPTTPMAIAIFEEKTREKKNEPSTSKSHISRSLSMRSVVPGGVVKLSSPPFLPSSAWSPQMPAPPARSSRLSGGPFDPAGQAEFRVSDLDQDLHAGFCSYTISQSGENSKNFSRGRRGRRDSRSVAKVEEEQLGEMESDGDGDLSILINDGEEIPEPPDHLFPAQPLVNFPIDQSPFSTARRVRQELSSMNPPTIHENQYDSYEVSLNPPHLPNDSQWLPVRPSAFPAAVEASERPEGPITTFVRNVLHSRENHSPTTFIRSNSRSASESPVPNSGRPANRTSGRSSADQGEFARPPSSIPPPVTRSLSLHRSRSFSTALSQVQDDENSPVVPFRSRSRSVVENSMGPPVARRIPSFRANYQRSAHIEENRTHSIGASPSLGPQPRRFSDSGRTAVVLLPGREASNSYRKH